MLILYSDESSPTNFGGYSHSHCHCETLNFSLYRTLVNVSSPATKDPYRANVEAVFLRRSLSPRSPAPSVPISIGGGANPPPVHTGCHGRRLTFAGRRVTLSRVGCCSTTMKSTSLGLYPSAYTLKYKYELQYEGSQ